MNKFSKSLLWSMMLAAALGGCKSNETKPDSAPQAEAAPAAQPAQSQAAAAPAPGSPAGADKGQKDKPGAKTAKGKAAPAAPAEAPAASNNGPYNLSKNKPVTDSTKVEAGQGTTVKGLNDWEGEISGIPAANSKFTKLKIGMSLQQVIDLVGTPTDQGAYVTGKAFIPFYYGSDRARWEAVYKGQGRLIFSTQAGFGWGGSGQYLVWIIHNSNEPGNR